MSQGTIREEPQPWERTNLLRQQNGTTRRSLSSTHDPDEFFSLSPVSRDQTVSWVRVALIFVTGAFSLPTFLTGIDIFATSLSLTQTIFCILVGNALVALVATLCGVVGARTRLCSYALATTAFGKHGAAALNMTCALSLLGWFAVNLNLFASCIMRLLLQESLLENATDSTINVAAAATTRWKFLLPLSVCLIELFGGIIMTITTMYGFRALKTLSLWLAPLLAVFTVFLVTRSVASSSIMTSPTPDDDMHYDFESAKSLDISTETLSFGQAVSSIAGLSIVGAIISPDYTRFLRIWHGAVYSAALAFFIISSIVEFAAGFASIVFQKQNFVDVLLESGLAWEGAVAIILAGSWTLNAMNLYSATLSLQVTGYSPCGNSKAFVGILGLLGTLLSFVNILDEFLSFLLYLSMVFAPVAGVIVMDYAFLRRSAYDDSMHADRLLGRQAIRCLALAAWACGILAAVLGCNQVINVTSVAALDAFVVAAGSYIVFMKVWLMLSDD